MRIIYILTSLGIGGAENQAISTAERMAAKGHKVMLIVLKHGIVEEWPVKLPVLRLNMAKSPQGILRGLRFARNFIATFQPDLLHSHTYPANMFLRMLRASGVKGATLNTIHNVYEGGWHRMLLYRLSDHLADRVTAISSPARDRFIAMNAVKAAKTDLITNGVDPSHFLPDKQRRVKTRVDMQAGNKFIWIAVGRLSPAKDYPTLLTAFAKVRESFPNSELWIVGEGDSTQLFPIAGVRFLGLRRDIVSLLDAADGFVSSSIWEGMPLAVAEAMSMKKMIVATSVGGVSELLGDSGAIVDSQNPSALADAMLHSMQLNESVSIALGTRARNRILEHFSINAKAEEWESLYLKLVPNRSQL